MTKPVGYNYFNDSYVGDQYAPYIDVNNYFCRMIAIFFISLMIFFSIVLLISTINLVILK